MHASQLPHVDEHTTTIAASVEHIYHDLVELVDRAFSGPGKAGITGALGCAERTASGPRPLAAGSTLPGFRVTTAIPGSELALEGNHRFSSYALIFRLEQIDSGSSRLRAETRAAFPGMTGGVYRLLVIGTGGHVFIVRGILSLVRRRSERRPPAGP